MYPDPNPFPTGSLVLLFFMQWMIVAILAIPAIGIAKKLSRFLSKLIGVKTGR